MVDAVQTQTERTVPDLSAQHFASVSLSYEQSVDSKFFCEVCESVYL